MVSADNSKKCEEYRYGMQDFEKYQNSDLDKKFSGKLDIIRSKEERSDYKYTNLSDAKILVPIIGSGSFPMEEAIHVKLAGTSWMRIDRYRDILYENYAKEYLHIETADFQLEPKYMAELIYEGFTETFSSLTCTPFTKATVQKAARVTAKAIYSDKGYLVYDTSEAGFVSFLVHSPSYKLIEIITLAGGERVDVRYHYNDQAEIDSYLNILKR